MEEELIEKIEYLKSQHKDMDEQINDMIRAPLADMITIQRLKKKKLELKDLIARLESSLQPDMIA
jgi:hypothetical protein